MDKTKAKKIIDELMPLVDDLPEGITRIYCKDDYVNIETDAFRYTNFSGKEEYWFRWEGKDENAV